MSDISNLEKYKKDLSKLIDEGDDLLNAIQFECYPAEFEKEITKRVGAEKYKELKKDLPQFVINYQSWYSEAIVIIKLLLPDRLNDFIRLYEKPSKRKDASYDNYVIEDYLQGLTVTRNGGGWDEKVIVDKKAGVPKFLQQLNILKSVEKRFESSLFDIKQLVQADLFDSELDAARELNKHKFSRGAGAIAGVVLEGHLSQVCINHTISVAKKDPTISTFNDLLKSTNVIDVTNWRFIQHLGDIRNKCDHKGTSEPTKEEVDELINGVEKIIKTIF